MNGGLPVAFLSGAVGPSELVLVFFAILVLFGPKRLPEIARTVGKIVRDIQRASREFQDQVMQIEEETRPRDVPPGEPKAGEVHAPAGYSKQEPLPPGAVLPLAAAEQPPAAADDASGSLDQPPEQKGSDHGLAG